MRFCFWSKPGIATGAFLVFCLGGEAPTTYLDLVVPNPWRPIPEWLTSMLRGAARPALLLFALCLLDTAQPAARRRVLAGVCAGLAALLGTLNAYGFWLLTYAGAAAERIDRAYVDCSEAVTGWIAAAFLLANGARLVSDAYYPRYLPAWLNGVLVSATIVPIVTVEIAVVRQRFFDVDFVVGRAIVYVALTAAAVAVITVAEELGTYVFYNNTDLAYGFIIAFSLAVGAATSRLTPFMRLIVDRFIFRDRRDQRRALDLIEGYILDAESADDVYRALLADATHVLKLAFGGFFARLPDGDYRLAYEHDWPADCITLLAADDDVTKALTRTRGAVNFSPRDTAVIARTFPGERLTFAAPIFFDRQVLGIVVYGHSVSGLDLDPDEREHLVRVIAHASIALSSIELARYRAGDAAPAALPERTAVEAAPLPREDNAIAETSAAWRRRV